MICMQPFKVKTGIGVQAEKNAACRIIPVAACRRTRPEGRMKKIGIGYENYKEFIDQNLYYVDKTLLVRDVLEKGGKVTLLTRPRRFGKTLGLSMLRTFFELEYDFDGNVIDKRRYFEGMRIMQEDERILSKMGQYPVIKLSLKGAKQPDFETAFLMLRKEIVDEFGRHGYLEKSPVLSEKDRDRFRELLLGEVEWSRLEKTFKTPEEREAALQRERGKYAAALKELSAFLELHHQKKTVILLDEYDVPLENAWQEGFYPEMISFIRSLFESALKTNDALEFAVVTGCLRISRESIFTGMNNLNIISIRSGSFSEGFGFTEDEVMQLLEDYGLAEKAGEVRAWYDGYLFGNEEIYNPWSLTKYVYEHLSMPDAFPEPYWSNTSSNTIVRDLVLRADEKTRKELDTLIEGGTIEKPIHEEITYADIHASDDNLWNFLFFTGYMKKVSERREGEDIYVTMCIPNLEIRSIYRNQIQGWFEQIVQSADRAQLYRAVRERDTAQIGKILTGLLKRSISTFDSAESFYHGFLLSMLIGMPDYSAMSNREEGDGRPDVTLYPEDPPEPAYLFEVKTRKKFSEMQDGLEEAFRQIRTKRYEEGILDEGYAGAISYGICFCKKSCIVGIYHA